MVVRIEDYVAAKLIVDDRVNEFNKNNPSFETEWRNPGFLAEWRYEESEFYSDFVILMRCRDNSINCSYRCSIETIIKAYNPRDYIDHVLNELKLKIMKHVGKE